MYCVYIYIERDYQIKASYTLFLSITITVYTKKKALFSMAPKKRAKKESSAIVTRTSSRIAKPKLGSDSDPQPPPINVSSGSRKEKLDSDPKPPKSKKAKANTTGGGGGESSSMGSKKKADTETPAIVVTQRSTRQSGKAKVGSNVPPLSVSKKAGKNTSDDGGESSSMDSKKKANVESAAIVTESSIQQRGIGKVGSNVPPDSSSATPTPRRSSSHRGKEIAQNPKTPQKKMANVESSGEGKAKLESKLPSADTPSSETAKKRANMEPSSSSGRRNKGKVNILEGNYPRLFKPVKLSVSEVNAALARARKERADVQPTSGVLTRRGNPIMGPDPQSPKSKKAKPTASTSGSTGRSKAKMDSDPTPPADPEPPKSKKAKPTASTSDRGKAKMGSDPTPPADPEPPKSKKAKPTASTSNRGKAKMGSDPTPPKRTTRGNSSVSATPRNKRIVEASTRVLRSA